MARVILKPTRERSLLRRHPWVYSGAIARIEGEPAAGATVEVCAADGRWLARGAWSPDSQIVLRVWTFDADEAVDTGFFRRRLRRAWEARLADPHLQDSDAWRLVNAEADGLPGLIVDRYGDWLVLQFGSRGADHWRRTVVDELAALDRWSGLFERSDLDVRAREGLEARSGPLWGEPPPTRIEIWEQHHRYLVDVHRGHKTGFYLDQRTSRRQLGAYCREASVLNGFAYTGAFSVVALAAGAGQVVNLDSSAGALALGQENLAVNGLDRTRVTDLEGNAFQLLRRLLAEEWQFDVVVLDPPRFIDSRSQLERAARGYKDINRLGCLLLRPGGILATFSCSGLLESALFQKIVADAALDAGRDAQLLERLGQASDHPVLLSHPEGAYLKGLVCRVG
ncbi:MAG: class I SAM-dependent methyltransferase [Candidatus Competibacterales bacterium]|nr:class I SAM-dependent methyltransferase [Candidatus Competibacterales bacterium]